jgi:hypothetical protein
MISVVLFGFLIYSGFSAVSSLPEMQFNVTNETVYLNWTNSFRQLVHIGSNVSYTLGVQIFNGTSLNANYSQESSNIYVNVTNGTDVAINITYLPSSAFSNFTLTSYCFVSSCQPGRYRGTFNIRNSTNSSENASITVISDFIIPISTNGTGTFKGTLPANATEFQSFFFDPTVSMPNATSIFVNVTFSAGDLDVFLLTNDSTPILLAKAINKTGTNEKLYFFNSSVINKTYEIRIYGNTTSSSGISYNGTVIVSSLNSTYQSLTIPSQNITLGTPYSTSFTLTNLGNTSLSSVSEHKELFYVKRVSGSGPVNYSFMLPDSTIVSKLEVNLNWSSSNSGNYTLRLFNTTGHLVEQSVNDYVNANFSQVEREEYLNETNIDSSSGIWTIEVNNTQPAAPIYTLTVKAKVDDTAWLTTNFSSTNSTFNPVGLTNVTRVIGLNLTVPNSTLDGLYEGNLYYQLPNDGKIKIPFSFYMNISMLMGNNTFGSKNFQIDENWGVNLSRTIKINITNLGTYAANVIFTNSTNLTCSSGSCTGYYPNLTFDNVTTIAAKNHTIVTATISWNSTTPRNTLFEGWILVNSTTWDANLTAHPNSTFRINLKLNLTDRLNVTVINLYSNDYYNSTINVTKEAKNLTTIFQIRHVNMTFIEDGGSFDYSKIFNVWLYEPNSTTTYPASSSTLATQNMTYKNYTPGTVSPTTTDWRINITIPINLTGGRWQVHVNLTSSDGKYRGESNGLFEPLIVYDTGLYMTAVTPTPLSTITAGDDTYFNVSVKNFGVKAASSAKIKIYDNNCAAVTITSTATNNSFYGGAGCSGVIWTSESKSGYFTFDLPAYSTDGCWFRFKIHGEGNGTCSGSTAFSIKGYDGTSNWYNNVTGITLTVNPASSTSTTDNTGGAAGTTTTTTTAAKHLEITTYPTIFLVEQKKSNSTVIVVKNINTSKTQDISLKVLSTNSSWFTISPLIQTSIGPLKTTNFTVSASIPAEAEVKDYDSKFVAIGNYANVSVDFKLRVTPSPEKKAEINQTFQLLKLNYTKLSEQINRSKSSGVNTTEADAKFAELTLKINQAQAAISAGDYFTANVVITDIKSLLDQTYTALANAKKAGGFDLFKIFNLSSLSGNTLYIIIAVVGVAGGLILAYLFWPTKIKPALQERLPLKISVPKISIPRKESKETYLDIDKLKPASSSEEDNVWDKLQNKWAEFSKKRYSYKK